MFAELALMFIEFALILIPLIKRLFVFVLTAALMLDMFVLIPADCALMFI